MRTLKSINSARNLMQVLRELSLDDLRENAERPPRLLVMAPDVDSADAVAEQLTGEHRSPWVTTLRLDTPLERFDAYEAVVLFDPDATATSRVLLDKIIQHHPDIAAEPFLSLQEEDESAASDVRRRILERLPERAPSFGRHFPAFVSAAVKLVIDETSVANAQFALIANVPSIVPLVGSLASATADLIVLTKNQILLVFKIAAIHRRDLRDQTGIIREMLPVAGAGFFWRTLAREATTLIPMAAGTVPKVAIAYSGTMAIGRAADYYYRFGKKPSKALLKEYYALGMESLKRREFLFRNPRTVDAEFRVFDDDSGVSGNGRPQT